MTATTTSLGHAPAPGTRWAFDASVADCFDDMLERSIPGFPEMRAGVTELASTFVCPGATVVDLGCSLGGALAPLVERHPLARFVGVEVSEPMLEAARARFAGAGNVSIESLDLRRDYPTAPATVTLAVLTLQFTPIEHRLRILRNAWKHTVPGGALLLVEKVLGASAETHELFVERYHALKRAHGYSQEEIDRKRLALEGALVPVTARWNEELLRSAGFAEVDCFWRWMNFAGWLAVK
jgi:tRNA (cmo5U34)-methyltransferase